MVKLFFLIIWRKSQQHEPTLGVEMYSPPVPSFIVPQKGQVHVVKRDGPLLDEGVPIQSSVKPDIGLPQTARLYIRNHYSSSIKELSQNLIHHLKNKNITQEWVDGYDGKVLISSLSLPRRHCSDHRRAIDNILPHQGPWHERSWVSSLIRHVNRVLTGERRRIL